MLNLPSHPPQGQSALASFLPSIQVMSSPWNLNGFNILGTVTILGTSHLLAFLLWLRIIVSLLPVYHSPVSCHTLVTVEQTRCSVSVTPSAFLDPSAWRNQVELSTGAIQANLALHVGDGVLPTQHTVRSVVHLAF